MPHDSARSMLLCLVADAAAVEAAVRAGCPAPHQIDVYSRRNLVNDRNSISEHGLSIVKAAAAADALLVDWELEEAPALNTLCYHVRREQTAPVFVLCSGDPDTMASGVAAGADDALTLPINLPYLQAKVLSYRRLVLAAHEAERRSAEHGQTDTSRDGIRRDVRHFDDLHLDLTSHRFFVRDVEVKLTAREFALLAYLIERGDILCTRDQILDAVWGITFDTGTNMVDVYMHFLRKKLEAYGLKGVIKTVRGHGYRLVHPEPS